MKTNIKKLSEHNSWHPVKTTEAREDYIAQNYDGAKMSRIKLSLECDVSESYIRRIVQKYKIKEMG